MARKNLGEKLYELRMKKGWTLAKAAEKSGIAPNTIAAYEKGKCDPTLFKASWLASLYGVSLDYLAGNTEYRNREEEEKAIEKEKREKQQRMIRIAEPGDTMHL